MARRRLSGGRQLSQTSGVLMDPAAAADADDAAAWEAPALPLLWDLVVSSGSLDADLEALVVGDQGVVAFGGLAAVSSVHTDAAFEDLVVESEHCVVSFWVHTALDADFGALDCTPALRSDAAWAAGELLLVAAWI